jgi:hypothetical protein
MSSISAAADHPGAGKRHPQSLHGMTPLHACMPFIASSCAFGGV